MSLLSLYWLGVLKLTEKFPSKPSKRAQQWNDFPRSRETRVPIKDFNRLLRNRISSSSYCWQSHPFRSNDFKAQFGDHVFQISLFKANNYRGNIIVSKRFQDSTLSSANCDGARYRSVPSYPLWNAHFSVKIR